MFLTLAAVTLFRHFLDCSVLIGRRMLEGRSAVITWALSQKKLCVNDDVDDNSGDSNDNVY